MAVAARVCVLCSKWACAMVGGLEANEDKVGLSSTTKCTVCTYVRTYVCTYIHILVEARNCRAAPLLHVRALLAASEGSCFGCLGNPPSWLNRHCMYKGC